MRGEGFGVFVEIVEGVVGVLDEVVVRKGYCCFDVGDKKF